MDSFQTHSTSAPKVGGEPAAAAELPPTAVRDKVRLRFRKEGNLRLLSHHDLLRCFERLLRRASLPVHHTRGFHPHPRLVFALSLPLGVVGCEEVVELELDEQLPLEEVLTRLRLHCPPGIQLLSARRIDPRTTAQVRAMTYRVPLPAVRVDAAEARIGEVLASTELRVARVAHQAGEIPLTAQRNREEQGTEARRDLRPFLRDLRVSRPDNVEFFLEMDLWLTPVGTARPVEVLGLLGLLDLLEEGAVLERARLELHDEETTDGGVE